MIVVVLVFLLIQLQFGWYTTDDPNMEDSKMLYL